MFFGQYWAHIDRPPLISGFAFDSGYSTGWPSVHLFWSNGHGGGNQYDTEIKRGSPDPDFPAGITSATSLIAANIPAGQTHKFWARHRSDPVTTFQQFTLERPKSDWRTTNIYVPPKLSAFIQGPDGILVSGFYTWDAGESGGTPPYNYQWLYQEYQGGVQVSTLADYTRRVVTRDTMYFFVLTFTVNDYNPPNGHYWADAADMMLVVVDPTGGEGGGGMGLRAPPDSGSDSRVGSTPPRAALLSGSQPPGRARVRRRRGFVDLDGTCAIPATLSREERHALIRRLWSSDTGISVCWVIEKESEEDDR